MAFLCGCSGFSNTLIWSRSSREGMLRTVNAGPTILPDAGMVIRATPCRYTLRNPRLKSCVHSVAVLTPRSLSSVSTARCMATGLPEATPGRDAYRGRGGRATSAAGGRFAHHVTVMFAVASR